MYLEAMDEDQRHVRVDGRHVGSGLGAGAQPVVGRRQHRAQHHGAAQHRDGRSDTERCV